MNPAYVVGDPAGMRRLAAQFRARSAAIRRDAEDASRAVGSMQFEAPVAHRLRADINAQVARQAGVAGELEQLARALDTGADHVAQAQAEAKRAARAAAQKAEHAAKEARDAAERVRRSLR